MKNRFVAFVLASAAMNVAALPLLEEPVPLPAKFNGIITIYPDNYNTPQVQNFWIAPSTARIVRRPDGKLAFGLVHSGISSFDPDGISALLTATFQPYVDEATMKQAKTLITKEVEEKGGKAYFRYIAPKETEVFLMVGGQYVDWEGRKPQAVVKGGLVEAGMPFQFKVTNSQDARALSQAGGPDANTIGVLYRMKFDGLRGRCHFTITANFKETYEHFRAAISASGWYGLVKTQSVIDIQTLTSKDALKVDLHQCTKEKFEKYYPDKAVDGLLGQIAARSGAFARTLKASGLPDAPGGGGQWGWSLNFGGGFEKYDESRELRYEYDLNFIEEQEYTFGMTFPSGGAELETYVKNITDSDKAFPTSDDFKKIAAQHRECRRKNVAALQKLKAEGAISPELYEKHMADATDPKTGCYSDYTTDGERLRALMARDARSLRSPAGGTASNVPADMVFELLHRGQ